MSIRPIAGSVPNPAFSNGKSGCPRLFFFCLLAVLALTAGCAKKQVAELPQPQKQAIGQEADIVAMARANIGVPYRFGGKSPQTGFDCSGFVCWTYEQVGIQLPRRASEQVAFGAPVKSRQDLKPGDIVAFKGTRSRTGWHSGIYTGNGKFIHSPNKGKTVTEDSLDDKYYAQRYFGACRIPRDGSAEELYAAYQEKQRLNANAAKASKKSRAVAKKKGAPKQQAVKAPKSGESKTVAAKGSPARSKSSKKNGKNS